MKITEKQVPMHNQPFGNQYVFCWGIYSFKWLLFTIDYPGYPKRVLYTWSTYWDQKLNILSENFFRALRTLLRNNTTTCTLMVSLSGIFAKGLQFFLGGLVENGSCILTFTVFWSSLLIPPPPTGCACFLPGGAYLIHTRLSTNMFNQKNWNIFNQFYQIFADFSKNE